MRAPGRVTMHPPTASENVLKRGCRTARRANERDSEDKDAIPEYLGIPVEAMARATHATTQTRKNTLSSHNTHTVE
jgi:hypothetical protein